MFNKIITKFSKSRVIIRNLSTKDITTPCRGEKRITSLMTHCNIAILEIRVKRKTTYSFTKYQNNLRLLKRQPKTNENIERFISNIESIINIILNYETLKLLLLKSRTRQDVYVLGSQYSIIKPQPKCWRNGCLFFLADWLAQT